MKYELYVIWLAITWIFKINLGDRIWYQGKQYSVANGTRCGMWRLYDLKNDNDGWVKRSDCRKVISLRNYRGSFKSGLWFYRGYWLDIWKRNKPNIVFKEKQEARQMNDYGIITCSKHNYTGTSAVCPHCYNEQQDNYWKRRCELSEARFRAAEDRADNPWKEHKEWIESYNNNQSAIAAYDKAIKEGEKYEG